MSDTRKRLYEVAARCACEQWEYAHNDEEFRQPIGELRRLRDRANRKFRELALELRKIADETP